MVSTSMACSSGFKIKQFHSRNDGNLFIVYHLLKLGRKLCEVNVHLNLSATFTGFTAHKRYTFIIPDNLSGFSWTSFAYRSAHLLIALSFAIKANECAHRQKRLTDKTHTVKTAWAAF